MRLLMVGPSGVIAMRRPVGWMVERGHDIWLVDTANRYARPLPPTVHFVPFLARGASRFARVPGAPWLVSWLGALQLRALATWLRPDAIHVHKIDFRALCAARAGIGPLVLSAWGTLNQWLIPGIPFVAEATARRVLAATDLLLVETPSLIPVARALASPPPRIELLPLGVDPTRFRPGRTPEAAARRAALAIPDDAVVLLSPRGWQELYNHHRIVEGFARARPHFRRPAVLALLTLGLGHYASAAAYQQRVRALAAARGVEDALRWLRPVPHGEMHHLYALADVVINYPATDAFPSTLVEAAAAGCPTLTADLLPYRGTFIDEHLTLVPPDDPVALAEALVAVVNTPPDPARLAAARQAAIAAHDERRAADTLDALYRSL